MLKTEFEDRFGKKVTDERYAIIERVYMATKLTKDEFVAEFKKISKEGEVSPMLLDMVGAFEGARDLAKQLKEERTKLCRSLISLSDRDDITQDLEKVLRAKALEQLGEKAYLTALLEMGISLNEDDRELMKAHLS